MTRDEAMALWAKADRAGEDAYVEAIQAGAVTADDAHKTGSLAAATVIQQAFAERDGEIAMLTEALRGCGRAVEGGAKEPRANVRFIVGETLQALAAKGDSRG